LRCGLVFVKFVTLTETNSATSKLVRPVKTRSASQRLRRDLPLEFYHKDRSRSSSKLHRTRPIIAKTPVIGSVKYREPS
jgi:hypothetical protein